MPTGGWELPDGSPSSVVSTVLNVRQKKETIRLFLYHSPFDTQDGF